MKHSVFIAPNLSAIKIGRGVGLHQVLYNINGFPLLLTGNRLLSGSKMNCFNASSCSEPVTQLRTHQHLCPNILFHIIFPYCVSLYIFIYTYISWCHMIIQFMYRPQNELDLMMQNHGWWNYSIIKQRLLIVLSVTIM